SECADPDARVSLMTAHRLWGVLADHTGEECVGLRCASRFDIEVWGGYGLAVRASSTVRETVENANRHLRLLHDAAQFRLVEEGLRSRIVYEYVGTELRPGLQGAALMLVGTVELYRRLIVSRWAPICATFEAGAPADRAPYDEVFGVPVHFGQEENAIVLDAAVLDEPLLSGDPGLSAMYRAQAEEELARRRDRVDDDGGRALLERLRATLRASLGEGDVSIDVVAKRLAMSARTLQRRLRAADTTYQLVLDQIRHEMTLALLKAGTRIDDAPLLLGYSDMTAFRRAFKRWTNKTPRELQREQRSD
ncbi:MAG: AraC family transcriptional regulator, partial [Myxococcales bacterium]|nr:AraC family transcriptional regulator [Myxococcales bacterium]